MSRRQSRLRRRRALFVALPTGLINPSLPNRLAKLEELRAELADVREDPVRFWAMLVRVAASKKASVWDLPDLAPEESPFTNDELAMVALAAAPHIALRTPGAVLRKDKRAKDQPAPS